VDYVFELHAPDSRIPGKDGSGAFAIEFTLGYLPAENAIVVMSVMLIPTDESGILELCFGIRRKEVTERGFIISEPDYSKEAVDAFIPQQDCSTVHRYITDCTYHLVDEVFPPHILMETFYTKLPVKALTKYEAIVETVIRCGYRLDDHFRDDEGRDYWSFGNEFGGSSS
jgi:hypothetical protein